jgi:hypothetical protein
VEPPSIRRWIGVGAALSGLPAAGGCFCAALLLALVADPDPSAVYEQERWLVAAVMTGAACAFAAMMGWATLRHGGLPAPVLLLALAVAGVPFVLPGGLFLPAAVAALAACAALATYGLARPPASPRRVRRLTGGLAATALALAVGQAIAVGLHGAERPVRADMKATRAAPRAITAKPAAAAPRKSASAPRTDGHDRSKDAPDRSKEANDGSKEANDGSKEAPDRGTAAPDPNLREAAPPPAGAERFVRDYYAALDDRRFAAAWRMLAPSVQTAFGGFDKWRGGYARTVANSPGSLRVTPAGGGATVGLTLRAGDRDACGKTVVRRFAVTWQLARTEAGWRATAAAARALSGTTPAAAC